jgi:hypothetical protein
VSFVLKRMRYFVQAIERLEIGDGVILRRRRDRAKLKP